MGSCHQCMSQTLNNVAWAARVLVQVGLGQICFVSSKGSFPCLLLALLERTKPSEALGHGFSKASYDNHIARPLKLSCFKRHDSSSSV